MDLDRDLDAHQEIKEQLIALVREIGDYHKQLRGYARRIEELEHRAGQAGLERVKLALRAAYVKVSQSGQVLVEAHLNMGVPATAFEPESTAEKTTPPGENPEQSA